MRLRKRPNAEKMLTEHKEYVVQEPEKWKGKWQQLFSNDHPIHIEIGTGKGQFLIEKAKRNQKTNYIGIELQTSVLFSVLEKQLEEKLPNVQLIQYNALEIDQIFDRGEVEKIYLNFSDPWPKNRHEKRRLTSKDFLDKYRMILDENGKIEMKTDNRGLFEFSLVSFSENNWNLKAVSLDLHSEEPDENIRTEYEEKFSKKGNRINWGIFSPQEQS